MRPEPADTAPSSRASRAPMPLPEPATQWALWPTFLRRTLAEELVRPAPAGSARPTEGSRGDPSRPS